jgi:DNA-binding helix-hairpin-helix protein with protein kinase domain
MNHPALYIDGEQIQLGKPVGKGGEGDVYAVATSNEFAVKFYTAPDAASREPKIQAMIKARLAEKSTLVAFPSALVRKKDGSFAGFMMRLVTGHQPLYELYSPGPRKHRFPQADYRFLVRAASNVARAVAQVHADGCVIGDINHSGILISDKAIAALIDADSFQVSDGSTRFLCRVGVPEYTPPELQGQKLAGVVRTPNHDAFGLAIIIFQLLFMGRHPFVGIYTRGEMPIEKAIAEFRFVYSRKRQVGMMPPPGASDLTDVPEHVAEAFEAAFGPRSSSSRPTASRWIPLLDGLEKSLRKCAQNSIHYYSTVAKSCPWCDMENVLGVVLFIPYVPIFGPTTATDPGAASFDLDKIWAEIEAVPIPDPNRIIPVLTGTHSISPSKSARKTKWRRTVSIASTVGSAVVAIIIATLAPAMWFFVLGGGLLLAIKLWHSASNFEEFVGEHKDASAYWQRSLDTWKSRTGVRELVERRYSLEENRRSYQALSDERRTRIRKYEADRRSRQLDAFLSGFQIGTAKIRGIGPAKTAQLASFGIDTAADIEYSTIEAVPGFGPATSQPLLDWRRKLEAKFIYNPNRNAQDDHEQRKIEAEIAGKGSRLRADLLGGRASLQKASQIVFERLRTNDPELARADARLRQARADLAHLGLPQPSVQNWPAADTLHAIPLLSIPPSYRVTPIPSQQTFGTSGPRPQPNATTMPNCPNCGSNMVRRTARRGPNAGRPFWGCSSFPRCRGTRPI